MIGSESSSLSKCVSSYHSYHILSEDLGCSVKIILDKMWGRKQWVPKYEFI